jgi:hypothetical protein
VGGTGHSRAAEAGVRYTWDGEQSIGMLERSIPTDQLISD